MKSFFVSFFLLCLIAIGNAQNYRSTLSIGLPVSESGQNDWHYPNYDIDFLLSRKLINNFFIGIGSSYMVENLVFTEAVKSKIFSVYNAYMYEMKMSEKIKFLPQVYVGYAFLNGIQNTPEGPERSVNGWLMGSELSTGFVISQNMELLISLGYNRIFANLELGLGGARHCIIYPPQKINHFVAKIGWELSF